MNIKVGFAFLIVAISLLAIPVSLALETDISAAVACHGLINGTGTVHWTRDNTGSNVENLTLQAVDGAGNVILTLADNRSAGQSAGFLSFYPWTSAPQFNPITVSMVSPAGNSLPEQRHLVATGDCDGLPTYEAPDTSDQEPLPGPPAANLLDGRINNSQIKDVAAPVAVYCAPQDMLSVYGIDSQTGAGRLLFAHDRSDDTAGDSNQLLAAAEGVSLYLLSSGEYQLEAVDFEGLPYRIVWQGCDSATLRHLEDPTVVV